MRRVLVTGAGGLIGKHLVSELQLRDFKVHTLQFRSNAINNETSFYLDSDNFPADDLTKIIEKCKPEVIFHLAGTCVKDKLFDVNIGFAFRLINALKRTGLCCKIILIGSAAEYGQVHEFELPVTEDILCNPDTDYGISKQVQTSLGLAADSEKTPVVVARLFNVVGKGMPRHLALADLAYRLDNSQVSGEVLVGNLDVERDFIHVLDVARSLIYLADNPDVAGQIVNICSGKGIWLRSIVEQIVQMSPWNIELIPEERLNNLSKVKRMVGNSCKLSKLGYEIPNMDIDCIIRLIVKIHDKNVKIKN